MDLEVFIFIFHFIVSMPTNTCCLSYFSDKYSLSTQYKLGDLVKCCEVAKISREALIFVHLFFVSASEKIEFFGCVQLLVNNIFKTSSTGDEIDLSLQHLSLRTCTADKH